MKELQSKLTGLVRERNDALSLKAQIEEQHNIITAQLKAKVKMFSIYGVCLNQLLKNKQ